MPRPTRPHHFVTRNAMIMGFIFLITLLIAIGGYVFLLFKSHNSEFVSVHVKGGTVSYPKNSPLFKTLTPTPLPTYAEFQQKYSPLQIAELTKNWTTCTNTKSQFSIKYPSNQLVDYFAQRAPSDSTCEDFVLRSEANEDQLNQTTDFRVYVSPAATEINPEALFMKRQFIYYFNLEPNQRKNTAITQTKIGSQKAYRLDICCGAEMGANWARLETDVIIPTANHLYEIQLTGNGRNSMGSTYKNQDIYELMLATIKLFN